MLKEKVQYLAFGVINSLTVQRGQLAANLIQAKNLPENA